MSSTYTSELRLEKQADGENSTTWGQKVNTVFEMIEDSIAGLATIATTGGNTTLTTNNSATDEARMALLKITGTLVSNATIIIPAATKEYIVWNATSGAYTVTVKTSGGTGAAISQGAKTPIFCDGTDTYRVADWAVSATDKLLGRSTAGAGAVEEIACTAAGRAILDDADAAAQRTTLGAAALAGLSTQDFAAKKLTLGAGALIESEGAAVTAASSTNIWAGDGNTVHVTGNTGIADFATAPQAGAWMKVIFDGTPLLTQSANLNLNAGGANIQIAAGDFALVYADTTTQMDVFVTKKDGTAVAYNAGVVVQTVEATPYTGTSSSASVIAIDSSIPQNTEGVEYITVTITPKATTNRLRIECDVPCISANASSFVTTALFQDSTANALAACVVNPPGTGFSTTNLRHEMQAGTTSATTFKLRIGTHANTVYINQSSGGSTLGAGTMALRMRVIEIAA